MEKTYRIKANVNKDTVLNVNLKRDVDLYEVLSLKLSQEKIYKLHSSDYGVIVGRVLANDAFGVPNAKVSVFIPISDADKLRSDISTLYPYTFINSYNYDNIRFNTLPNYKTGECHKPVGTFPQKRIVLDEDISLEIYDKYYKYTTVTNNSGDYMIFGVPVGDQIVHVDIDLSDIGVLSQRPTDLIYKGYSVNLFESASEFKKSTNLNELPQIITEDSTVNVYPFWGDESENEIAITRKDVRIQYKFEPTCVFLGSVMTDSTNNHISHDCVPGVHMGEASQLVPSEGTIEMIRKTIDDKVEEVNIKGNQLIDSDGVFCYQIPMNLDYVCTDEYGNISPTDNPNKGIPTRARVRFRVTLSETGSESLTAHKARYLIPNNPDLYGEEIRPFVNEKCFTKYYEFGTLTDDDCFRDLLWNKVYSVKNYIPRIQKPIGKYGESTGEYLAIKGVNKKNASGINPIPYNKLNLNFSITVQQLFDYAKERGEGILSWWKFLNGWHLPYSIDAVREKLVYENDGVGLDFYNDWINGCLYFPNWYLYIKSKKEDYKDNDEKYNTDFCDCETHKDKPEVSTDLKLCVFNNCSLKYTNGNLQLAEDNSTEAEYNLYNKITYGSKKFDGGIIKKTVNKDGAFLYYYSFGQSTTYDKTYNDKEKDGEKYLNYVRLFSTDIILLGSLDDCDIHGIPKVSKNIPSTTSLIPPIGRHKNYPYDESGDYEDDTVYKQEYNTVNGMNWGDYWLRNENNKKNLWSYLSGGLFFGLTTATKKIKGWMTRGNNIISYFNILSSYVLPYTDTKSCVNAERICELNVTNDSEISSSFGGQGETPHRAEMDGLITRNEIQENDTRSLFATLNSGKLITETETDATGYKTYNLTLLCPYNFDGRLERVSKEYTNGRTKDVRNRDYLDYRFGSYSNNLKMNENYTFGIRFINVRNSDVSGIKVGNTGGIYERTYRLALEQKFNKRHFYGDETTVKSDTDIPMRYVFPLYENSFYFYFGLNPAHNAISVFYKNFMAKCTNDNEDPFSLSINSKHSNYCGENIGEINVTVGGVSFPYTLTLEDDGGHITTKEDIYTDSESFSGLSNSNYILTVEDSIGQKITREIILKQEKVSVNYSVTSNLLTKFNDNKDYICEHKLYGKLKIVSFKKNGTSYNRDILSAQLFYDDGIEKLRLNVVNEEVSFVISTTNNTNIGDYYCGFELDEVFFGRNGNFILRVEDTLCPSVNYSDNVFSILNPDEIELYINSVPLKLLVGLDESNLDSYQSHFYNKNGYTTVNDVRGWFGMHDPKTYYHFNDDGDAYKEMWQNEAFKNNGSIIETKLKMLFKMSENSYVTNTSKNKFIVTATGDNVLIRSAYPQYNKIQSNEQKGTFTNYITCNVSETDENGVNCNANIVGNNYTIVDSLGQQFNYIQNGYDFNPKYNNNSSCAGNYFAAFSNNANYLTECQQVSQKTYVSIPFGANDLSSDGLCTNGSVEKMLPNVYSEPPYFRTEFIDRRLDYDFVYVTPCETRDNSAEDTIWARGRVSGITYNGIEMLYNGQYNIVSTGGDTEYTYNTANDSVTLNNSSAKMLYESNFEYGGQRALDLRTLYWSKFRKNITSQQIVGNDGIKVIDHSSDTALTTNEFDNFGLSEDKNTILGYPTKRILDIYNIPYGDGVYKWSGKSCMYDSSFTDYKRIAAKGDDAISHKVEFSNILIMTANDATYTVKTGGDYEFDFIRSNMVFHVQLPSFNGVNSIKFINDTSEHEFLNNLKTCTTNSIKEVFDAYDSDNNYVNQISSPNGITIGKNNLNLHGTKFIGVGINYTMRNNTNDGLLKKIDVFNVSNYFNVDTIKLEPDTSSGNWYERVSNSFETEGTQEVQGYVEIDGERIPVNGGGSIESNGEIKYDKFKFILTTNAFIFEEIDEMEIKVRIGGQEITYVPTFNENKISVILSGNNKSIEKESADVTLSIRNKNGLRYILPFRINKDGEIKNF